RQASFEVRIGLSKRRSLETTRSAMASITSSGKVIGSLMLPPPRHKRPPCGCGADGRCGQGRRWKLGRWRKPERARALKGVGLCPWLSPQPARTPKRAHREVRGSKPPGAYPAGRPRGPPEGETRVACSQGNLWCP